MVEPTSLVEGKSYYLSMAAGSSVPSLGSTLADKGAPGVPEIRVRDGRSASLLGWFLQYVAECIVEHAGLVERERANPGILEHSGCVEASPT